MYTAYNVNAYYAICNIDKKNNHFYKIMRVGVFTPSAKPLLKSPRKQLPENIARAHYNN